MHGQPMLTLPLNRSRSSKGHNLFIHCSTLVADASCRFVEIGPVVPEKNSEGFLPYMGVVAILVI